MVTMIEIDIRAVRREYDEGEIWMVAVGYGSSDLDPALKALLGPDASDKPEWPIWSAAVLDGEIAGSHLYYPQSKAILRWLS